MKYRKSGFSQVADSLVSLCEGAFEFYGERALVGGTRAIFVPFLLEMNATLLPRKLAGILA